MKVNLKGAICAPFRSVSSILSLLIGSIPSMAFWWVKAHDNASPLLLAITFVLCFGSAGYSVRVIRTARSAAAAGETWFDLPTWLGDPRDMLRALLAGVLGVFSVLLPVFLAIGFVLEFLTFLLTGHLIYSQDSFLSLLLQLLANGGDVLSLIMLPTFALLIAAVLYIPVMMVHYAARDRISAVFELSAIVNQLQSRFWLLMPVILGAIVIVASLNAAFYSNFVALSIVGFAADVIVWALVAEICNAGPLDPSVTGS